MTTTPTFWGNEVTFSFDISAFSPKVTALADNTFAVVWENGTDLFGRHLDERGSFIGGDFLNAFPTSVSTSSSKDLSSPFIVQQDDGRVVVNFNELFAAGDLDIRWHSPNSTFTPQSLSFPVENSGFDEFLVDTTARSDGAGTTGTAIVYEFAGPGGPFTVLRFVDAVGNQASNQIFVGVHNGEIQQNAAIAGRHTGHVEVVYENFNKTTFARDIRFHTYAPNETDTSGEVFVSASNVNAAFPDVVALRGGSTGDFVVVWQQNGGIAFRRYFGEGTPLDATPLGVPNSSGGFLPKITALNDGGFIIAWTTGIGTETDGSPNLDVVMQRFNASGTPIGTRLDINKPGDQGLFGMSIATLDDGRVILTYGSETGDSTNITTLNYRIVDPREAAIFGSNGNDNIVGREDGSQISGFDGNDKLSGREASDVLDGGTGADTLLGFGGNDTLVGLDGNDSLDGGSGNDSLDGGKGNDRLIGGTGNDSLWGGNGNDFLLGGDGNDTVRGTFGDDTVIGGNGNDLLVGGSGNDRVTSGSTNDVDIFRFEGVPEVRDRFTDFDRVNSAAVVGTDQDIIQLRNLGFNPTGGASDLPNGVLPANRLVNGTASLGALSGFRYFAATGQLFFDSNGGNQVGSVLVATLSNLPSFASMAGSITVN